MFGPNIYKISAYHHMISNQAAKTSHIITIYMKSKNVTLIALYDFMHSLSSNLLLTCLP